MADDLLHTGPPPRDLLVDKGFAGAAFAAGQAAHGTAVLLPPAKRKRHAMPPILRKIIAAWRNRIETTFGEITDLMGLAWPPSTAPSATCTSAPSARPSPPPGSKDGPCGASPRR